MSKKMKNCKKIDVFEGLEEVGYAKTPLGMFARRARRKVKLKKIRLAPRGAREEFRNVTI